MLRTLRSLRARITLFATLAVTVALVAAALGLVFTVERTLLGRLTHSAIEQMDRVATALSQGRDPNTAIVEGPEVLVQVLDEDGELIDTVPDDALFAFGVRSNFEAPVTDAFVSSDQIPTIAPAPSEGATIIRQLNAEELILAQKTVETPDGKRTVVAISPFSGVSRSIDTVVTSLWIGTPLLIAFVGLITWYFTGRTLKPVAAITQRADEISHSTLDERLPTPGTGDEVDHLGATLNSMLDRLEDAARRQREFVSDASHELRSPLAAIIAQLEVALAHPDSARWQDVATDALGEAGRLDRLVGDLLTLARADELAPKTESVDLIETVEAQIERYRDPRITVHGKASPIRADRDQIEKMVTNLLDNARRHARDRIDVSVTQTQTGLVLCVDDDGPGVRHEERERIFERFTRLEDGRTRDAGGVGIGLALVARIAAGHGGSVVCQTSALGGASFQVRLPSFS